jgi:hypothetical protein
MEPGTQCDKWQARADLLTPVAKAWCTDRGCEIADLAIQIHGGMGYIEDSGAAQIYRDVRITSIYEGTNGIQAIDLLSRKVLRDGGAALFDLSAELRAGLQACDSGSAMAAPLCRAARAAIDRLERCSRHLIAASAGGVQRSLSVATPYQRLFGSSIAASLMVIGALQASQQSTSGEFERRHLVIAAFYCASVLPETLALEAQILADDALASTAPIGIDLS